MGKKLISDEAWATVTEGVFKSFGQGQQMNVMTDYASWKWSDVAKAAGAGLAAYVIGSAVNGQIKVTQPQNFWFSLMCSRHMRLQ